MADLAPPAAAATLAKRLQAWLLRAAFLFVRLLPLPLASDLGGFLGRTFGPFLPRTKVARANLACAFPEKSPGEIKAIVRAMWDNLGRTALEYAQLDRFRFFTPDSRIEVDGLAHFDRLRDDGQPGIIFSAHLANWELLGKAAAARGLPVSLVYRAPNNPFLGWLFEVRRSGEAEMVAKGPAGAKRMIALLKQGAHLGLLMDQKMNDGIAVPFFGREAMTAPALAQFAFRFDCPVLPVRIQRLPGVRFRIQVEPPLQFERTGDRTRDERAAMVQVNTVIERWVRDTPEQWLWLHRRWPR